MNSKFDFDRQITLVSPNDFATIMNSLCGLKFDFSIRLIFSILLLIRTVVPRFGLIRCFPVFCIYAAFLKMNWEFRG